MFVNTPQPASRIFTNTSRYTLSALQASPPQQQDTNTGDDKEQEVKYNTEFGYSRKDIIVIGVGLIAFGYILYYGLQFSGMDAGMAGNWVQLLIFVGICIGWVGSYLYRVANKQMTYVKQLESYEEAVMAKRLEEMPEVELEQVIADIEKEKEARRGRQ